jgi:hypothetical protein
VVVVFVDKVLYAYLSVSAKTVSINLHQGSSGRAEDRLRHPNPNYVYFMDIRTIIPPEQTESYPGLTPVLTALVGLASRRNAV